LLRVNEGKGKGRVTKEGKGKEGKGNEWKGWVTKGREG
jgi:hypothetical protein